MSTGTHGRLLLVEDEDVLRRLVHQFLELENYEVAPAADGQEAVEVYADRGPFDVVLLDLNLPRLPGVEACRQIKRMNPAQPFLVCSAAILESHFEALAALGVHDTLGKPYHPRELLTRIRCLMGTVADATAGGVHPGRPWRIDGGAATGRRSSALSEARALE
ncbi:response regulator transcription factor [Planctomyces sp. SH-PL62]|uniref:response regulator transcription factor n=1 Tax=Planctomyces sp. SH-PL62 TaxID=1636152 RepID=UPI00078EB50F|nr:response regulator [Planctomyces sp. SH-PL62]AMV38955.1 Alkaline phosphatase synthesis transcriptional regulatory protein PhoP [Planctomyces sp. SH-PL62]